MLGLKGIDLRPSARSGLLLNPFSPPMSAGKSISAQERGRMLRQHSANDFHGSGKARPKLNYSRQILYNGCRNEDGEIRHGEHLARKLFFIVFELFSGIIFDLLERYAKSW